jgi:hypothetical protein
MLILGVPKIEIRQGEGRFHLQYGNERQFPLSLPTPGRFLPDLDRRRKPRGPFLRALLQRKLLYRGVDQELVYEIESKRKRAGNTFRKPSNIELQAGSRKSILRCLRLSPSDMTVNDNISVNAMRRT